MTPARRRGWELPERAATAEGAYLDRREFLRRIGFAGAGLAAGLASFGTAAGAAAVPPKPLAGTAGRAFAAAPEGPGVSRRNFREFSDRRDVERIHAAALALTPWRVKIDGLVEQPRELDVDALIGRMPLEERTYRHRCVSGWAAALPWTGFPLAALVAWARPLSSARYLRVVSFLDPAAAPNQGRASWYPWPYAEAYRLDEATHELAFVATGIFGHSLPPEHGAPLRIAMPWKYGYKSAKAIVRFEFTERQPATFWSTLAPARCDWDGNVNSGGTNASGSQANEIVIGTGEARPTLAFNGYAEFFASLS